MIIRIANLKLLFFMPYITKFSAEFITMCHSVGVHIFER